MELEALVKRVAAALEAVDARCPAYVTRAGRKYQPGIGPYPENAAMRLVVEELRLAAKVPCGQFIPYPGSMRQKCDLWIGEPVDWVVEVKMGRFRGDNGKPDDTAIKDLISPFRADRSALADGSKLAESRFDSRKAILVYGFDDSERPFQDAIEALALLLRERVELGPKSEIQLRGLRHPVFQSGAVVAWEVGDLRRLPAWRS